MGMAVSALDDVNCCGSKRDQCESATENSVLSNEICSAAGKTLQLGGEGRWDVTFYHIVSNAGTVP